MDVLHVVDTFDDRLVHSHARHFCLRTEEEEAKGEAKGDEVGAHEDLQRSAATHLEVVVNHRPDDRADQGRNDEQDGQSKAGLKRRKLVLVLDVPKN